jgi:hypothetical protein
MGVHANVSLHKVSLGEQAGWLMKSNAKFQVDHMLWRGETTVEGTSDFLR